MCTQTVATSSAGGYYSNEFTPADEVLGTVSDIDWSDDEPAGMDPSVTAAVSGYVGLRMTREAAKDLLTSLENGSPMRGKAAAELLKEVRRCF